MTRIFRSDDERAICIQCGWPAVLALNDRQPLRGLIRPALTEALHGWCERRVMRYPDDSELERQQWIDALEWLRPIAESDLRMPHDLHDALRAALEVLLREPAARATVDEAPES